VLSLGRKASNSIGIALVVAVLFHGSAAAKAAALPLEFMLWSQQIGQQVHERLFAMYDIEVAKPPPEPDKPPPPPEPVKEEPKANLPPPPPPTHAAPKEASPPPAPAAAQAGAVLTKAPDPNEPVDLTNQGFVTGSGSSYAGGVTEQAGTSTSAVYNRNARAGGVAGGTGSAPAAPGPAKPDLSQPAKLSGSSEWKCPWPSEADAEQIDEAYVSVQVATKPDGSADHVTILSDPGHGFGREARLCAMRERYNTALDHDGNPIPGLTKAFRIHFER
jgi:protein TonB